MSFCRVNLQIQYEWEINQHKIKSLPENKNFLLKLNIVSDATAHNLIEYVPVPVHVNPTY